MNPIAINLTINGEHREIEVAPWTTLLDLLRERLDLTGTKKGCDHGQCGAFNRVGLGADPDGTLRAIRHDAIGSTSSFEDHQEVVVNWSGLLYYCDNVKLTYELAQIDTYTPGDMRAPGAPLGVFALESAMDELAHALRADPLALRLKNLAEADENEGKQWTSNELRAALQLRAERFGWSRRSREPRSVREGRDLVGWGMACGIWEASMQKTSARATLTADGRLEVGTARAPTSAPAPIPS